MTKKHHRVIVYRLNDELVVRCGKCRERWIGKPKVGKQPCRRCGAMGMYDGKTSEGGARFD